MLNRKSFIKCFLSRALDNWLGMIFRSGIDILHCVTIIMFCRWLPSAERLESFNSAAAWRSGVWRSICKAKQELITADKSHNLWFDFVSIKIIGKQALTSVTVLTIKYND